MDDQTKLPDHLFLGSPCRHHPGNRVKYVSNKACTICACIRTKTNRRSKLERLWMECIEAYGSTAEGCVQCGVCNYEGLILEPVEMTVHKAYASSQDITRLRQKGYPDRDKYRIKCLTCNKIRHYHLVKHAEGVKVGSGDYVPGA